MAKTSALDKLQALKAKLETSSVNKEARSSSYWNPKEGSNTIRILPEVGNMDFFYAEVGIHYLPNGDRAYCPKIMSEGRKPCPICQLQSELYQSGDKDLAGKLRVSHKYWFNIIDRNDEDAGPQVYTAPKTVFASLASLISDPEWGLIMDVENGVDIVIDRIKTGNKPWEVEYQCTPRRQSTPLHKDPDVVEKWLEDAKELTIGALTGDPEEDELIKAKYGLTYGTYDTLVEVLEKALGAVEEDMEDEDEEEEEDVTAITKKIQERRKARKSR